MIPFVRYNLNSIFKKVTLNFFLYGEKYFYSIMNIIIISIIILLIYVIQFIRYDTLFSVK